ncbi:MAG: T9SS type A sorting domain-containing protein, partial [Bacteroidota bacterium]
WLAFSAEQENEGELFEWQTAREFEIDRYIVEWQVPDGEFAPVDTVAAAGTPVDTTSYSFLIAETPVGMYRFRVEAIGRDGTSTLSPEILTEVVSSVLLNGFEAMLEGFSVRLRWVSIAEIHMESVVVEVQEPGGAYRERETLDTRGVSEGTEEIYEYLVPDLPGGTYEFRLAWIGEDGTTTRTEPIAIAVPDGVDRDEEEVPAAMTLEAPYPNPSRTTSRFRVTLPEPGPARVVVFDALSRPVRTLLEGVQPAGTQELIFDATSLPAGRYLIRLDAGSRQLVQSVTVVR